MSSKTLAVALVDGQPYGHRGVPQAVAITTSRARGCTAQFYAPGWRPMAFKTALNARKKLSGHPGFQGWIGEAAALAPETLSQLSDAALDAHIDALGFLETPQLEAALAEREGRGLSLFALTPAAEAFLVDAGRALTVGAPS